MNDITICGFGERAKFNALKTSSVIEFIMVGKTETICSATYPDGSEKTFTLPNSYIEKAIQSGALEPKKTEQWLIQRDEDRAYFTSNHRWSKDFKKAGKFDDEIIDSMLDVMHDRGYAARKIAL